MKNDKIRLDLITITTNSLSYHTSSMQIYQDSSNKAYKAKIVGWSYSMSPEAIFVNIDESKRE